jgi:hypothetical protein
MAKPSIVLVHGFWGGAAHWAKVIIQLSGMGYDSIAGVENPLTSLANDADRTRPPSRNSRSLASRILRAWRRASLPNSVVVVPFAVFEK